MATNKKPTHTLRCGNIKATIWQNVSEKGPFFATTFSGRSVRPRRRSMRYRIYLIVRRDSKSIFFNVVVPNARLTHSLPSA